MFCYEWGCARRLSVSAAGTTHGSGAAGAVSVVSTTHHTAVMRSHGRTSAPVEQAPQKRKAQCGTGNSTCRFCGGRPLLGTGGICGIGRVIACVLRTGLV